MYSIDNQRNQLVVSKIIEKFGNSLQKHELQADMLCIHIDKGVILSVLHFLRFDPELEFQFLTTLCGMHHSEKQELIVVYHLHSFKFNHRIRIKTSTPVSDPYIASATKIWESANWMERETFDFYGIRFIGHPNLRRILNQDEMTDFPMRKDFPLEDQTRVDKNDSLFGR